MYHCPSSLCVNGYAVPSANNEIFCTMDRQEASLSLCWHRRIPYEGSRRSDTRRFVDRRTRVSPISSFGSLFQKTPLPSVPETARVSRPHLVCRDHSSFHDDKQSFSDPASRSYLSPPCKSGPHGRRIDADGDMEMADSD